MENKQDVIEVIGAGQGLIQCPRDEPKLLEWAQQLLQDDRQLLLPLINALSSLPLSIRSKV